jgi:formate-dependent nitrite reductase membrane component NrfD
MGLETYELIPHFIKRVGLREHKPWISGFTAASVLLGGFVLRIVIVYAGQMAKVIT